MSKLYTVELTAEQMEQLGLKIDPFELAGDGEHFYYVDTLGRACKTAGVGGDLYSGALYNHANYCTDKKIMEQRALHETLNRLLWRFSMQNYGGEIDWGHDQEKYFIYFSYDKDECDWLVAHSLYSQDVGIVYFDSEELANQAIAEVIIPFLEQHPEFEVGGCCL